MSEKSLTLANINRCNIPKGNVGMELEIESKYRLPDIIGWNIHQEGSLRGDYACEYVSYEPFKYSVYKEHLNILLSSLSKFRKHIDENSIRTSFHVHFNVCNSTPVEIWTTAVLYWLLETPMMQYCGPSRQGNRFCLRLKDAEAILRVASADLLNDLHMSRPFTAFRNNIRYGAMNLSSINKFGSLEFRGMRGTLDYDILINWMTGLERIVEQKVFTSPSEVLNYYINKGAQALLDKVFDNHFFNKYINTAKNYDKEILLSAGLLTDIAYIHDWKEYEESINKTYSKQKKEEKFLLDIEEARRIINEVE